MKAIVILNASAGSMTDAGGASAAERVEAAFAKAGIDAEIRSVEHDALPAAVKEAAATDADVVVIGGGDGTLNTGAAEMMGNSKPMGVLPLGTLNHFARDLGIPFELDAAVAVIAAGHAIQIDLGEVNGHIFVNNSSIGLYPLAVEERDELRHRNGGGKTMAMLHACVDVMRRFPLLDVELKSDQETTSVRVPFIFIGNNRYDMSFYSLGKRLSLQDGELGVYFTQTHGRWGVLRLAFRALIGRMKQDRDFRYVTFKHVEIRTRRRAVRISLDGEVLRLTSPIRYSILARSLKVLAPAPAPKPVDA